MAAAFDSRAYFEGRDKERRAFVAEHAGKGCDLCLLVEDMASRRYFRVTKPGGATLILMEAIPDYTGAFTPGHKLSDFVRIDRFLRGVGVHVPQIHAQDDYEGYVLLEDFGDVRVSDALANGATPFPIYENATDTLIALRDRIEKDALDLPRYYDTHIHKARRRIIDWYVPATRHAVNGDDLLPSYLAAWDEVERALPACPMGFVHGDFHVQNLMVLKSGDLGVLDFQGAMWGPLPYDLANLLEDMRYDVPDDVYEAMLKRYGGGADFAAWYRVLATQFHCRMMGQVLKLAIVGGKPRYLEYMPRLQRYLKRGLADPVLAPLAAWFDTEKVDLDATDFVPYTVRAFIRPDAF